jgi:hypothetical protein
MDRDEHQFTLNETSTKNYTYPMAYPILPRGGFFQTKIPMIYVKMNLEGGKIMFTTVMIISVIIVLVVLLLAVVTTSKAYTYNHTIDPVAPPEETAPSNETGTNKKDSQD